MKAILRGDDSAVVRVLYMALELSKKRWKLGFGDGSRRRVKTIEAGDLVALGEEVRVAREKLGVPGGCAVVSCYEAGRDGFWIHRALQRLGVVNVVVDSASIEVSRRRRQVKTDRVDVESLLALVVRWHRGERQALRVVRVPTVEQEGARRLTRERERLVKERGSHRARIKSLLVSQGIVVERMGEVAGVLERGRERGTGGALSAELVAEIEREVARCELVDRQIRELERAQQERVVLGQGELAHKAGRLQELKGVGQQSSWVLSAELFGWREFSNGKQVAACAGLTPTAHASGERAREQGISKAGNRRIRALMVELSWLWLRYQGQSELSRWFRRRFAQGGSRQRRIGIVALARKLLVALWRYVEDGVIPAGAVLKA